MKELLRREEVLTTRKVAAQPTESDRAKAKALIEQWVPGATGGTFLQQREFFFPVNRSQRRRVARCTRRAGKTTGAALKLLVELLLNPRAVWLYIAKTTTLVRDTIWPELKRLAAENDLPFEFNETNLRMSHKRSTGRAIFRGASDIAQIEKLRGLKLNGAILDESGTFGASMENLVVSVIGPSLRDLGGELLLIGTPGYFPEGLFYEASEGLRKNWARMSWSLQDNPFISDEAKDYDNIMEEEGLTVDDPIFIREWLGKYAINTKTQMFAYDPAVNSYDGPMPQGLTWWLGVDFGWTDATAIVALGFDPCSKVMYAHESWSDTEQDSDQIAVKLTAFIEKYKPTRIIGDCGGYGKGPSEKIFRDYRIYIEQADKIGKLNHVEFLNAAFRRKAVMVNRVTPLHSELPKVLWNEKKSDAHNKAKDNNAMALLYVWLEASGQAGRYLPKRALKETPGLEGWPEEELTAKLGNQEQPVNSTPWYYL